MDAPRRNSGAAGTRRPTVGLVAAAQLLLIVAIAGGSWWTAPGTADRLLTVTIALVLALGVLGQDRRSPARSRLPAALQGAAFGAAVAATLTVLALDRLMAWGLLALLFALPPLFPAVVPARWRPAVTLRWQDLTTARVDAERP